MQAHDYARAQALLEHSFSLDPTPGALLNLADCEEHLGHLFAAYTHFRTTEASLPPSDDRRPIARSRADALDRRLPHLIVQGTRDIQVVVSTSSLFISNGRILNDDALSIPHGSFGTPVVVEPGPHNVVVIEDGATRLAATFDFQLGQTETVNVDVPPASPPPLPPNPIFAPPPLPTVSAPSLPADQARPSWNVHFIAQGDGSGWVLASALGDRLCDLPCDRTVTSTETYRLVRPDRIQDIVIFGGYSLRSRAVGSKVVVRAYGGGGFMLGFQLVIWGSILAIGSGAAYAGVCDSESCGPTAAALAGTGIGLGAAGIATGAWMLATHHIVPGFDISVGAARIPVSFTAIGPSGVAGVF